MRSTVIRITHVTKDLPVEHTPCLQDLCHICQFIGFRANNNSFTVLSIFSVSYVVLSIPHGFSWLLPIKDLET